MSESSEPATLNCLFGTIYNQDNKSDKKAINQLPNNANYLRKKSLTSLIPA